MTQQKQPNTLPPLWLPLQYLAFAALCFALAMAGAFRYADDFTGFYYHSRILAMTHLITLGWITASILGMIYIIGPMSLQMLLPARILDHLAFWLFATGVGGMVAHFWIAQDLGMAWSAILVYVALLFICIKVFRGTFASKAPGFVKLHLRFAVLNILAAAGWGLTIALNKTYGFLPTGPSPNVLAHAHLAAIGWALMTVFGTAYRLLPMFLPGEPAKGRLPWISAVILEIGALGLFLSLLFSSRLTTLFTVVIASGIVLFLIMAVRTALRRKPAPPPEPPSPDFAMLHAVLAFLCMAASVAAGLALTRLPATAKSLQLALAYGFVGLVGFLGQMVVGMKPKILSVFTWYYAFTRYGTTTQVTRPVDMPVRAFQATIFFLWLIGIPLFTAGVLMQSRLSIQAGALALLTALLLSVVHEATILRRIWRL